MAEVRKCARCGDEDTFPRHYVSGFRVERQNVRLSNGTFVPVDVPVDETFHIGCHAAMGCEHCSDVLEHNGGDLRREGPVDTPPHLETLEPGEFDIDEFGVHTRALSKEDARAQREQAAADAGVEVIDADEADALHAAHARGELNG